MGFIFRVWSLHDEVVEIPAQTQIGDGKHWFRWDVDSAIGCLLGDP